jgi:hypothetical protein
MKFFNNTQTFKNENLKNKGAFQIVALYTKARKNREIPRFAHLSLVISHFFCCLRNMSS